MFTCWCMGQMMSNDAYSIATDPRIWAFLRRCVCRRRPHMKRFKAWLGLALATWAHLEVSIVMGVPLVIHFRFCFWKPSSSWNPHGFSPPRTRQLSPLKGGPMSLGFVWQPPLQIGHARTDSQNRRLKMESSSNPNSMVLWVASWVGTLGRRTHEKYMKSI